MDREVLALRDSLSPKFTQLIYNGFWFSPEMDFIRAAFGQAQELIDGVVRVQLFKGGNPDPGSGRVRVPSTIRIYRPWTSKADTTRRTPVASSESTAFACEPTAELSIARRSDA